MLISQDNLFPNDFHYFNIFFGRKKFDNILKGDKIEKLVAIQLRQVYHRITVTSFVLETHGC